MARTFFTHMSRLQREKREPGNNIHTDSPGFTGTQREKGKLCVTELSPHLPQDQGQTKVIAVGGFLHWGKAELICFIDSFFLSTNSYRVPTKCQALCYPIFHWEEFRQVPAGRGYHLRWDKERYVYPQASEAAIQTEFQGLHLIFFSLFCIVWVPQNLAPLLLMSPVKRPDFYDGISHASLHTFICIFLFP